MRGERNYEEEQREFEAVLNELMAALSEGDLETEGEWEAEEAPSCPRLAAVTVTGFPRYAETIASLPTAEQQKVRQLAGIVVSSYRPGCHQVRRVELVGHADRDYQRGPGFEQRISAQRALTVQRAIQQLIGNPAIRSRIVWNTRGAGAGNLVVPSPRNEAERSRNRRVEVALSTGEPQDHWEHAVEENDRLERSLAWQAYRSSIVQLLGFNKSYPDDYAFAAAVARWQKGQPNLPSDGIIGPKTLKRVHLAMRSALATQPESESPQPSFHKLDIDRNELRRLQREIGSQTDAGEAFATDPIPLLSKDGHSSMTLQVAKQFPHDFTPDDVKVLVEGSRRPDKNPPTLGEQTDECQQRRHCLRGRLCQEVTAALRDIRGHLAKLYRDAMAKPSSPDYLLLGEALHLIQDSYSPAHTEREQFMGPPYLGAIIYVRYWHWISPGYPTEHGYPADVRDTLDLQTATGVAAATASREFLQVVVNHKKNPGAPDNQARFEAYIGKHLGLSSSGFQTVAAIIRLAVRSFDPDPRYASYLKCLAPDRPKNC